MKSVIAAMEIFGTAPDGERRRLTVAVGTPARSRGGDHWACTVTIADVLPPTAIAGEESFAALAAAVGRVRSRLAELEVDGWQLFLDRSRERPLDFDAWLSPLG